MKQNKKAIYLQKETYEETKKTITNIELEKLQIISNHLLEYFEMLSGFVPTDLGLDIALKLKSLIEKIEEANK